jgi:hypothetical protein
LLRALAGCFDLTVGIVELEPFADVPHKKQLLAFSALQE